VIKGKGKGDDQLEEDTQDSFLTSYGTLLAQTATKITKTLINQAYLHQLSPHLTSIARPDSETTDSFTLEALSRYNSSQFYRIIINTGATKRSTAGIS
jgi:hypothetical protein